uniref:Uncharacterized protein n=1 Tax=Arundo donax TaxID=35708 RepID=A0A0A9FJK9_ARUDO
MTMASILSRPQYGMNIVDSLLFPFPETLF